MFSRALPRASARISRFTRCEASHPQIQTFAKLPSRAWRPIKQQNGKRQQSTFVQGIKETYRQSPFMFPLAVGIIVVVAGFGAIYLPWYYQNVIVKPYHNFPEPVAKKLRRAVFYSKGKNADLKEGNKYFRQALALASEMGMDPFSPEILGVKYAIARLYELGNHFPSACEVLEIMRADCQRWMDEYSDKHWTDGDRSRILKVIVQLDVKMGELYTSKYMNEPENAEKRLTEAVTIALKEKQRRETDGVKEGEGDWMTNEEIGGALESLGSHYEANDAHYLATPLFVQALSLCPPTSCHGVVLMNNISTCLAQQTPPPSSSESSPASFPNTPAPSRSVLVDQARQWASKALAHAATIKSPDRDEDCDVGCAVATHNLGEFFEMEGKIDEARQKYKGAQSLSKSIGFKVGQHNAQEGLKRLKLLEESK